MAGNNAPKQKSDTMNIENIRWEVLPPYTDRPGVYPIGEQRPDGAHDIIGEINSCGGTESECAAKARMAAAAPVLYRACRDLLAHAEHTNAAFYGAGTTRALRDAFHGQKELIRAAREALKQAEVA